MTKKHSKWHDFLKNQKFLSSTIATIFTTHLATLQICYSDESLLSKRIQQRPMIRLTIYKV